MNINLSLASIRAAYEAKEITPKELIYSLRAAAIAQSDYNAWITVLDESQLDVFLTALEGKTPSDLPLFGVPFAIKDNIDLAGIPTTAACPGFEYTPETSSFLIEQLIAAGAVPLGKTNLDQFATGLVGVRSPYGEGKNVFNKDYISGGSSAGSAIATALGQVSFALGTDTAGSGRIPAALNNLIGHKPSKGLLSNSGLVPACRTLDCISIFALNTDDAAAILDIAATYDVNDAYARKNTPANKSRYYFDEMTEHFKFAVPKQLDFDGNVECEALFHKSVATLKSLGGEAVEINFEPFLSAAKLLYEGPWVAERWIATKDVAREDMLDVIRTIVSSAEGTTAADLFSAQYKLQALKVQCDLLMEGFDFVLIPTSPSFYTRAQLSEKPIELNSKMGTYTNFVNLLDYAATAVPVGRTECGVHWGVTLFSHAMKDIQLLSYAGALHKASMKKQGATEFDLPLVTPKTITPIADRVKVVVCGAHLSGMPLNWQLTERGATLVSKTKSAPKYSLYALPDGKRPAMVLDKDNGTQIDVEVWQMPIGQFGSFVAGIPAPLGIGKVELSDGHSLPGFICETNGTSGAKDISEHGGWRQWLAAMSAAKP